MWLIIEGVEEAVMTLPMKKKINTELLIDRNKGPCMQK